MGYQSTNIVSVVKEMNEQYFLPAIQREFVWKPEQIVTLMDSIMRGYPINSFLFWKLERDNVENWDIYQFVQDFDPRDPHNETQPNKGWIQNLNLVLDGQQRLTSLLVALRGSYTIKKKNAPKNRPQSWIKQQLYLDLLKDGNVTSDSNSETVEVEVTYGFKFMPDDAVPLPTPDHYWFKVSEIIRFETEDRFSDFVEEEAEHIGLQDQRKIFRRNLQRLYQSVWKDDIITYHTELQQDADRVLDIFARTNTGGTKLSKSDLLLSMVTDQWKGKNAREEIYAFVNELNNKLTRKNDLDKDFILKTCLVVTDLPVQYRVENFTDKNLNLFLQNWESIKKAVKNTINLVNTFGIDRDTLTSANALIPIIYYLYKNPKTDLLGSSDFDENNRKRVQRWFIAALLNEVFSGQSDNMLTSTRRILQRNAAGADFPMHELNDEIRRLNRIADINTEKFLSVEYGDSEDFLALSLLYDQKNWGTTDFHKDHIFPQSAFKRDNLKKLGYDDERIVRYLDLYNRLGNLQLISGRDNTGKSDQEFEKWLTSRGEGYRREHLIPENSILYTMNNFEEFLTEREKLIVERVKGF